MQVWVIKRASSSSWYNVESMIIFVVDGDMVGVSASAAILPRTPPDDALPKSEESIDEAAAAAANNDSKEED